MMLENVDVKSIKVDDCAGAFPNSELQSIEKELILTHFVRLSQNKGEWVTEVTFKEFARDFVGSTSFRSARDFCLCIYAVAEKGYITIEGSQKSEDDILKVTEKFAELCEKYAA